MNLRYRKSDPSFSIIIPNYNHGYYLEKAILSVIEQDYPNKELIVIDGGSTDNSNEVIQKYSSSIAYSISEKDNGTYDANNKGLKQVTGDFWCVLNSDDILLPGALNIVADAVRKNPGQRWFTGGENIIDENDRITGEIIPQAPAPIEGHTFLQACWISHPCTFLHRDVIQEVGFFEKWHIMDYNYWLRMEHKGFFPVIIPEKVSALRIHSNCKSYDQVNFYKEVISIVTAFAKHVDLLSSQEVIKKIASYEAHIVRMLISIDLVANERVGALKKLIRFAGQQPTSCKERWFWGMLKRIAMGINEHDPILKFVPAEKSTASWTHR